MDLVSMLQQKLGQVGSVLTRDAGNECSLSHAVISFGDVAGVPNSEELSDPFANPFRSLDLFRSVDRSRQSIHRWVGDRPARKRSELLRDPTAEGPGRAVCR